MVFTWHVAKKSSIKSFTGHNMAYTSGQCDVTLVGEFEGRRTSRSAPATAVSRKEPFSDLSHFDILRCQQIGRSLENSVDNSRTATGEMFKLGGQFKFHHLRKSASRKEDVEQMLRTSGDAETGR
ncbi:hypothetical protein MAR_005883 [Mya arenaria]|uniref:Uncharacterized protein n=1 Tax=Mya arenaria TaxID=6604 RepID=A0ABY7F0R7_MYAAR|nr:hypothetical protein MAR_005883 [Mya arenaria]